MMFKKIAAWFRREKQDTNAVLTPIIVTAPPDPPLYPPPPPTDPQEPLR
jgi:hypothetical protein